MYHCTPQATGIMTQAVIPTVLTSNSNGSLGSQVGQGCSGNGTRLACLYLRDTAPANRKGTLKVLNATQAYRMRIG